MENLLRYEFLTFKFSQISLGWWHILGYNSGTTEPIQLKQVPFFIPKIALKDMGSEKKWADRFLVLGDNGS